MSCDSKHSRVIKVSVTQVQFSDLLLGVPHQGTEGGGGHIAVLCIQHAQMWATDTKRSEGGRVVPDAWTNSFAKKIQLLQHGTAAPEHPQETPIHQFRYLIFVVGDFEPTQRRKLAQEQTQVGLGHPHVIWKLERCKPSAAQTQSRHGEAAQRVHSALIVVKDGWWHQPERAQLCASCG